MALPKPRDVDLGVFVLDVDVLLVVDAHEIRPTVPQILERPALEEVHREHVMLVVCLFRPAARGKEQRGDGARPEEHARAEHGLGSKEGVPHRAARTVLIKLVGKRHPEEVVGQTRGYLGAEPSPEGIGAGELVYGV